MNPLERSTERTAVGAMTFDSTIHCGNGREFREVAPGHYRFRARVGRARHVWRFCFKIESPSAPGPIVLEVCDFNYGGKPVRWRETSAVYSYDAKTWHPIAQEDITIVDWTPTGDREKDAAFASEPNLSPYGVQFRLNPQSMPIWVASATPYTLHRRDALLARLSARHPALVQVSDIGESYHSAATGYGLRMIRITDSNATASKPSIFVVAGEHASETAGMFACEAMIVELLQRPDVMARFDFYFVPILNVDGVFYGKTYWNCNPDAPDCVGHNPARDWRVRSQREVRAVYKQIFEIRPDVFLNLHNGRHRKEYEVFCEPRDETDVVISEMRKSLSVPIAQVSAASADSSAYVLPREGLAPISMCFETLHILANPGAATHEESYLQTGRELLTGLVNGLDKLCSAGLLRKE